MSEGFAGLPEKDQPFAGLPNRFQPKAPLHGQIEVDAIVGEPMICEQHFWLLWPHDHCAGPGMPLSGAEGYNKQLTTLAAESRTLREALQQAVDVIDSEAMKSLCTIGQIHGCPYSGPVFDTVKAKALLHDEN